MEALAVKRDMQDREDKFKSERKNWDLEMENLKKMCQDKVVAFEKINQKYENQSKKVKELEKVS